MFRILRSITVGRQRDVVNELDENSAIGRDYILLVVFSCIIATFGLVQNSAAVVIGAMLIAPLMSPIIAFSLALVLGDLGRAGRALLTLVVGAALAIGISDVLGHAVTTGHYNFLVELPSQILSRTQPNLFDLAIALAGGAAAAYANSRPEISATLPGVAIATALMPPVCTAGIGLAVGRADLASGAFLLFLANFVAIAFASSVVFVGVGFQPIKSSTSRRLVLNPLLLSGGLLLVVALPLAAFTVQIAQNSHEDLIIKSTIVRHLAADPNSSLVSFEANRGASNDLEIVATLRSPANLSYSEAVQMQRDLASQLQQTVALKLLIVPVTQLDPLVPPTPVPTVPPGITVLPTHTPVPPSPTASPSPVPSLTPTATNSPTPTPTSTPTETPFPTHTPTMTPVAYAFIGGTDRQGANLRQHPGLSSVVVGVPDGTLVQLTGAHAVADGLSWVEVTLPDGRVGWVAQPYLVPYNVYQAP